MLFLLLHAKLMGQNTSYEIQEAEGFCYGTYAYEAQNAPICYQVSTGKTVFPFCNSSRRYFTFYAKRYSPNGYHNRIVVYDTKSNRVYEIDSCDNTNKYHCPIYLGFEDDTVYVYGKTESDMSAYIFTRDMMSVDIPQAKKSMLLKLKSEQPGQSQCISKPYNRVAYSNGDSVVVVLTEEEIKTNAYMGQVVGWEDEDHLLYTETTVEGFGDFYYNLYVFDIHTKSSRLIAVHLSDVFDFYNGVLLYSASPNILCMAKIKNGGLSEVCTVDLHKDYRYIYSASILNNNELIIGGDHKSLNMCYVKCLIGKDSADSHP